jgi:hypothetical protein
VIISRHDLGRDLMNDTASCLISFTKEPQWSHLNDAFKSGVIEELAVIISRRELDSSLMNEAASCLISFSKEPQWIHLNNAFKRSIISGLAKIISKDILDVEVRNDALERLTFLYQRPLGLEFRDQIMGYLVDLYIHHGYLRFDLGIILAIRNTINRTDRRTTFADLAQNSQNTHTASVHFTVSDSLLRLSRRYEDVSRDITLDHPIFNEIDTFLKSQETFKHKDALHFFQTLINQRADAKEGKTKFTTLYSLALIWSGINDDSITQSTVENRRESFIITLAEGNNTYGKNSPTCTGGSFNKIVESLSLMHPDVKIIMITSKFLSGMIKDVVLELKDERDEKISQKDLFNQCRVEFRNRIEKMGLEIDSDGNIYIQGIEDTQIIWTKDVYEINVSDETLGYIE